MEKTKKEINVGIIGCGGRINGVLSRVMKKSDRIKLAALCDISEDSINCAKDTFNFTGPCFEDYRKMLQMEELDWIFIGSWNCYHAEHTIASFEAGKHVFCEKPFATSTEDCRRIVQAWHESGKMFTIGFTLRYSPHYRKVKELVDAGEIGELISMEFNETLSFNHGGHIMSDWRRKKEYTGTHLLEKCCHDIDIAQWIVNSRARRVASFGGNDFFLPRNEYMMEKLGKNDKGRQAYMTWNQPTYVNPFTGDHDVVDNQVALIEYDNNVRAAFHTNIHSAIPERRMYLLGSEGALRADVIQGTIELAKIGFNEPIHDMSSGSKGGHGGGDNILAESVANSILYGNPPQTSVKEGFYSSVTTFGIDRAMDNGQVVEMAPIWEEARIEKISL